MEAVVDQYYGRFTAGMPVRVTRLLGKNKSLVAERAFKKGEILFMENPLGCLQHASNKLLVKACDHCQCFIGTVCEQLNKLATIEAPTVGTALPAEVVEDVAAEFEAAFPALPDEWQPTAMDEEAATITPVVSCTFGCAAEYCSTRCRDTAARQYHVLLCPSYDSSGRCATGDEGATDGMAEDSHGSAEPDEAHDVNAAVLFEHQAQCTNEIFLLAARCIARVLEAWVRNGNDLHSALLQCAALHSEHWPVLFAKTAKPVTGSGGGSGSSSTSAAGSAAGDGAEGGLSASSSSGVQARVAEWMRDSLTILRSLAKERMPAFVQAVEAGVASASGSGAGRPTGASCTHAAHTHGEACPLPSSSGGSGGSPGVTAAGSAGARRPSLRTLRDWEWDTLLCEDTYSRLIGAFELNNIEVKVASPLTDYIATLQSLPTKGGPKKSAHAQAMAAIVPVLEQVAAAKDARRELRKRLRRLEETFGEDEEGEGGVDGHHHGHSHGAAGGCMEVEEVGDEEEDEDEGEAGEDEEEEEDDDYDSGGEREERHEGYNGSDDDDDDVDDDDDDEGDAGGGEDEGEEEEEDDALDPAKLFPHANGTALFALISQANHSCEPNVQVVYLSGTSTGALQAKRDVAPGEELCINYVDVRQPLARRRADLRHYGFVCGCGRCVRESASGAAVQ